MHTLVTGVAGFIGSTLARRLLADGHTVVGIDAISDYYDESIKRSNLAAVPTGNFEFIEEDLLNADLRSLLDGVDVVYHLAGQPGVRKSWGRDFSIYTAANIDATQRLLEAVTEIGTVRRVVYASSSSVYGNAETYPTLESARPQPLSPYGVTKLAAEHLCNLYAANFGLSTVSLRFFTVYGPGQRPDMAFTRFIRAGLTGGEITVFGDGSQLRDFTYVDDIVEANILAGTAAVAAGSVFNVAGGSQATVTECLAMIEDMVGRPLNITHLPPVPGDVTRTGGSTAAIREALGWEPSVSLAQGLERQVEWGRRTFAV